MARGAKLDRWFRPAATDVTSRAALLAIASITMLGSLLSPGAGATASPVAHTSVHANAIAPPAAPLVLRHSFPGATAVTTLASAGTVALLALQLPSGATRLTLFNAAHNSTTIVTLATSASFFVESETSAGGNFFLQGFDATTGTTVFEKISISGVTTKVHLPLTSSASWSLIPADQPQLYASSQGRLLAIDPTTLNLSADLSASIPHAVGVSSVVQVGSVLYLGGVESFACCGTQPFAGALNLTTGVLTTLTSKISPFPSSGLVGSFGSVAAAGSGVYFGGSLLTSSFGSGFSETTVGGYLYRYDVLAGTFTNLSSLLPHRTPSIYGLYPVGNGVVTNLAWFAYNTSNSPPLVERGGTYLVNPSGTVLLNRTNLTGPTFAALYEQTSESGRYYFVGGTDSATGTTEVMAIPISSF